MEVGAPLCPLHRSVELAREQAARDELRVRRDLVPEPAADVLGDHAELVGADTHRGRHHDHGEPGELVVRRDRPLPGPPVELDEGAVELERRRVEAVEMELGDRNDVVGLCEGGVDVAPLPDARVGQVPAGFLVEHGRAVLERLPRVHHDLERVVVDDDELGGVSGELARLGNDGRDGLADVAHLADRERVVLHASARLGGDLEERIGEDRDLVAGQRPVDAGQLECGADVDGLDPRVRVRRAHEVEVAHPVPLDVVEEDALPLDEPPVLLARDALPDEPLLEGRGLFRGGDAHAAPFPTATTASTMFQ